MKPDPAPPVAKPRSHSFTVHGITVEDPYHWLKDQGYPEVDDPDVLAYLEAENAYFEAVMAPHKELVDTIYAEIKARQKPDDAKVPVKDGDYYYQWRFEAEGQYRIWSRWPADGPGAAEGPTAEASVILDEPALAQDVDYFRLGALSVSNDGRLMAYSTDTSGAERFTLRIKDLDTGELSDEVIENTSDSPVWSSDDRSFFYTVLDENWRPFQVRRHVLGTKADDDAVIYEEQDPGFFIGVGLTSSKRFVVISTGDHVTSEVRLIPTDAPERDPQMVSARREDHYYIVDHQGDRFVIRTNDTHKNNRLVTAPHDDLTESAWQTLVAGVGPTLPPGIPGVRGLHRLGRARRRSRSAPPHRPGGRESLLGVSGVRLQCRHRRQPRVRRPDPAPGLRVHGPRPTPCSTTTSTRANGAPARSRRFRAATTPRPTSPSA